MIEDDDYLDEPARTVLVPAAKDERAGLMLRALVGVTTLVAVAASVVPVTLSMIGLEMLALAGSSELLEHTGGLVPTTFGAGYWLGWLLNGSLLAWSAIRAIRRRLGISDRSPYGPIILLAAAYAFAGLSLVWVDLGGVDVPDVVTTTFLVGYMLLWTYVAPVFAGAVVLRLAFLAWRASALTGPALRALTASAGLALGGGTLTVMLGGGAERGYLEPAFEVLDGVARDDTSELTSLRGAALELSSTLLGKADAPTGEEFQFRVCVDTLMSAEKPSTLDRAIARLMRSRLSRQDAADLAYGALLRACEADALDPKTNVVTYFTKAVTNARTDAGKESRCVLRPPEIFEEFLCEVNAPSAELRLAVRQAMHSLPAWRPPASPQKVY